MGNTYWLHARFMRSPPMASLTMLGHKRSTAAFMMFQLACSWCARVEVEHIPHPNFIMEARAFFPDKKILQGLRDLIEHGLLRQFTHGYLPSPFLVRFEEPEDEAELPSSLPRKPPPALSAPSKPGFVYFVEASGPDSSGNIKIGFATNVAVRIDALQTGSPAELRLLATMPGTYQTEHDLHERFAHLRVRGEWFRPEPDLLAFIAGLNGGGS